MLRANNECANLQRPGTSVRVLPGSRVSFHACSLSIPVPPRDAHRRGVADPSTRRDESSYPNREDGPDSSLRDSPVHSIGDASVARRHPTLARASGEPADHSTVTSKRRPLGRKGRAPWTGRIRDGAQN
jgi:hypothetical protein